MADLCSEPLVRAVRMLSLDADAQILELSRLGHQVGIDELALQFDDRAIMADPLVDAGQISDAQRELVRQIDELLGSMSGKVNADLWTPESLRRSPLWARVRLLAKAFLDSGSA